jgi:hypothetical protein
MAIVRTGDADAPFGYFVGVATCRRNRTHL